jgi:SynChlorMet cassette protein ScmC
MSRLFILRLSGSQQWVFIDMLDNVRILAPLWRALHLYPARELTSPIIAILQSPVLGTPVDEIIKQLPSSLQRHWATAQWQPLCIKGTRVWLRPAIFDAIIAIPEELFGGNETASLSCRAASAVLFALYQKVMVNGGMPLHSALIRRGKAGFLLVGKSGSGKTTCCRRIPLPWEALADEELVVSRLPRKDYYADPFPNLSDITIRSARVSHGAALRGSRVTALLFLEKGTADAIGPINKAEAAMCLVRAAEEVSMRDAYDGSSGAALRRIAQMKWAIQCVRDLPTLRLSASLHGAYWMLLEQVYEGKF